MLRIHTDGGYIVRRRIRLSIVRDVVLAFASAGAVVWMAAVAGHAPSAAPPRVNGAYELVGSGPSVVVGRAVVSAQRVRVDGVVIDAAGNRVPFVANDLAIDRSTYRFHGTGTFGSAIAKVAGRLDPDDKTIKKCRISGMFSAVDGNVGRFMGAHR